MPAHEVYMHVGLLEALPKNGTQRRRGIDFLHSLGEQPGARGDYTEKDALRRECQVKIVGNFAVTYWLDAPVRTAMIVDIRKAD